MLYGTISILAAMESKSRDIKLVYISADKIKKRDRKTLSFLKKVKENNIPFEICEKEAIDAILAETDENAGTTHGGIVALCGERKYSNLDDLLHKTAEQGGFCVVLDGVEDPYNFGYSVRNLHAAGACGIIVPERNWTSAAGVCARTSAGATEMCDIAVLPDMNTKKEYEEFVLKLKKIGYTVVCAAKTAECKDLFNYEAQFPAIIFIGGEKRGISPEFINLADDIVFIRYFNDVSYSLPTASVAGILGFYFGKQAEN